MGIYKFCCECGKAVEIFSDEEEVLCERCEYEQFEDDLFIASLSHEEEALYMQNEF